MLPPEWVRALSVVQWMWTFLFLGPSAVLLMVALLCSRLWLLAVLYYGWWLWDWHGPERGPRHNRWVRNWKMWEHFCDYFPITVVRTAPLPPHRSYLLAAHPHGIACIGIFGAFVSGGRGAWGGRGGSGGPCPGLKPTLAVLGGLFRLPLYREYAMAAGLCPVSRPCLQRVLSQPGQALLIVVGGAAEALDPGDPECPRVTLKGRFGFVRMALRYGTPLVPVFVFGELQALPHISFPEGSRLRRLQRALKALLGFAPCVWRGRGGLPLLPHAVPLTVVVGAPLEVPRLPRPPPSAVRRLHGRYVRELRRLVRRHAPGAGLPEGGNLSVI
ncbi:diacylglycerol O-acyltransferase 2-like isoform X1 [Gallus gallus]|uniref:Acyltransferase n=1 Tax=Gallus gallus TaxID=9031 RepID=A0A8V0XB45_CHICK|nr:diacylglycerol O-acyltransferase 2-like isoform X1 [Gallus gallus]